MKAGTLARLEARRRKLNQKLDALFLKRIGIQSKPVRGLRPNPAFQFHEKLQEPPAGSQGGNR
jgi:hypothetical protein